MSWYRTGTITATNGSKIITAAGTAFLNPLNGVSAGRMLLLPAAGTVQCYEIASIQSDTQLTLVDNYAGETGAGKLYAIPTAPGVNIETLALEVAEHLAYYQRQMEGWQQILTGSGDVTLTAPDGQAVTVKSQSAISEAIDNLGNAATATVMASLSDATVGRLMSVGAFGIGGVGIRIPAGTDVLQYLATANGGKYTAIGTNPSTPTSSAGWSFDVIKFNENARGIFATPATTTTSLHRLFYNYCNAGIWSGWTEIWTNRNLANPMTLDTNQVLTAYKIFSYDGAGIILRPVTTGAAHFIRGQSETGANLWWLGRGSNTTQDVTLLNNIGGAYIRLVANGNMELNVTSQVTINGLTVLRQGAFGVGGPAAGANDANAALSANESGFIRSSATAADITNWPTAPTSIAWRGINIAWDANAAAQLAFNHASTSAAFRMLARSRAGGANTTWLNVLMSNQYTVDANGFIKTASPIVKLFGDGSVENNEEATGVVAEKIETGVYRISGCLGLNSDATWGGIEGGLSIPKDRNELPILWIDYDVDAGGAIIVKTFHRVHANAPAFAQNRRYREDGTEYGDAEPIDIPHDVFVSVRVQMPEIEEPTLTISHSNVYCGTVSPSAV